MKYRSLGDTGVVVSELGLGSHMFPLANPRWDGYHGKGIREDVSYAERRPVVERALELGITLFDCDFPFEKELLGQILRDLGARDQVVLAGWIDYRPESYAEVDWGRFDRALEQVLGLLQTECLDILDWRMSASLLESGFPAEFREHAEGLKAAGKIRATSCSTGDGSDELIRRTAETRCCDALYRGFGFLNPGARERVLPLARDLHLGFMGFIPFQKGWFFECAREAGLMADGGARIAAAGLRWVLSHAPISGVLVGVSTRDELEANCAAVAGGPLEEEDRQMLRALTETETYDRFLALMAGQNPHILHDWRVPADSWCGPNTETQLA